MIIGVLNQKGGVGKTTMSLNIAAELARRKNRVLLIDADVQGSCLDWAAARSQLDAGPLFTCIGLPRATIHKEIVSLSQDYDHIIIDGVPRYSDITRSAIMSSDLVAIPIQPSPFDVWSAADVVKLIQEAQVYKPALQANFLINRVIAGTVIGRSLDDALESHQFKPFESRVHQRVVFAEAAMNGSALFETEGERGRATIEVSCLVSEILRKGEHNG
ncbi:MAG: ParA family partition ATPase [Sideroxyarcus sp.]|nr:ParA family partition ATPase [Sideroxyarcus sp.]